MMLMLLIGGLTLIACLSPMLTLQSLWQLKEWRWDRLSVHLNKEGWWPQLFGTMRPAVVVLYLLAWAGMIYIPSPLTDPSRFILKAYVLTGLFFSTSLVLAGFTLMQALLNRQRLPTWTQKAKILTLSSIIIDALIIALILSVDGMMILPLMAIAQPFVVAISWLLFYPVDHFMKRRIMNRAKTLREQYPDLTVIGITGSVGKTTTKELLTHILTEKKPLVTPEHVNTDIGVSQWLIRSLPEDRGDLSKDRGQKGHSVLSNTMIVEMGAYRIGEIDLICSIAKPSIGIITLIGEEHLALFGSRQAIAQAKTELLRSLPENGHAFLNRDDDMYEFMEKQCECAVTAVSTGGNGDLRATDIEETATGIRFSVDGTVMHIPIQGTHNVINALLAIACAQNLGMSLAAIAKQLVTFSLQKNTFNVREEHGVTILDATYNASPQSFRAAIAWARNQPHAKKVLLTPGIIELGEEEEPIHRELAARAKDVFDEAYILSPRFLPYFREQAFEDKAHLATSRKQVLEKGTLFVCIGRMSAGTINGFLP